MNYGLGIITKRISNDLERSLAELGLLFRIFSRSKSMQSINKKLEKKDKDYRQSGRGLQDVIGVRVMLYFEDDIALVRSLAKRKGFEVLEEVKDDHGNEIFAPVRLNQIIRIPSEYISEFEQAVTGMELVDNTFELQIRTALSEGWHEVDHDLRYKCLEDWESHEDLGRMLNSVLASIENADWTLLKIFSDLAWRHYKKKNWDQMLRHNWRLRFSDNCISSEIKSLLDKDMTLGKELHRSDRRAVLNKLANTTVSIPITMSNIVFLANRLCVKSSEIQSVEPTFLSAKLDEIVKG